MGPIALAIAVAGLFASSADLASAGWSFNPRIGTPVCDTLGNQTQTVSVSDGAGGIVVGWIDTRFAAADVYAQRLTSQGEVAPGWPLEGLPVCRANGVQTGLRIAADGAGGAILAWVDFRSGTPDVYAQRITGAGTIAGGWTADGVAVCVAVGTQSDVVLASDGAQGAVFAWQDGRSGTTKDIYASRLLASGSRHPSWPLDGWLVCGAPGDQFFPAIVANGAGATLLAWQDARNAESDIFAQSLDGSGAPLWLDGGVVVNAWSGTQERPRIVSDGSGGAFVCWTDYRDAPVLGVYLQRLTSAGAMAPFWQFDGMPAAAFGGGASEGTMLADGAGGVFVAWTDTRSGSKDVYLVRIDAFGGVPPGWIEGGAPACAASGAQIAPMLASDGEGGVMIAWRDARFDNLYDVFGTRFTSTGSPADGWIADGLPFGNAADIQTDLGLVASSPGAAIATWSDFRNQAHWDVYANRMGPDVILDVAKPALEERIALAIAPQPVVSTATVVLTLRRPGPARLAIHDAVGRTVRVLIDGWAEAGSRRILWDGCDDRGRRLPSGVYFLVGDSESARVSRAIVRL